MSTDALTSEDCLDLVGIIDALGSLERAIHGPDWRPTARYDEVEHIDNGDAYLRRLLPLRSKLLAHSRQLVEAER